MEDLKLIETENLRKHIKNLGVDIYGISDMYLLKEMETGISTDFIEFIKMFPYAIVFF